MNNPHLKIVGPYFDVVAHPTNENLLILVGVHRSSTTSSNSVVVDLDGRRAIDFLPLNIQPYVDPLKAHWDAPDAAREYAK